MERLSHEERRRRLLAAGRVLWAEQPYDAVRPADITRVSGSSIGLIYRHFGNKRGYYVATVRDMADELLEATVPPLGRADPLGDTLRAYLDFVEREGALFRAVLRGGLGVDPEVMAIADGARAVLRERARLLLGLDDGPLSRAVLVGWIGACEAVALDDALCAELTVEQRLEQLVRMLRGSLG